MNAFAMPFAVKTSRRVSRTAFHPGPPWRDWLWLLVFVLVVLWVMWRR